MAKPTTEDLAARQKALDQGKSFYVRPSTGKRMLIRNRDNPRLASRFGGQGGTDEAPGARKTNRGGGSTGSRAINEKLATPPGADKKAFGKAMADAAADGMDGDHIQEVSRTAEGIRFKEAQGRGTRAQYHANMKRASVPVGNQAANVQPLPPKVNQQVKPAQLRAMDKGIQAAGSEADKIFGMFRNAAQGKAFRALGGITEYIQAADELTGGHIDRGIQQGVNFLRQAVGQAPNPIRDTYNLQEGG